SGEELPRRLLLVLDVDADHRHALVAIALPGAGESWRLLVAGRIAPGRPEVEDDDPPLERGERYRLAVEAGEGEGRRGLAHERRGNVARVGAKAVGQEREHGNRRHGNGPAQHVHRTRLLSAFTGRAFCRAGSRERRRASARGRRSRATTPSGSPGP